MTKLVRKGLSISLPLFLHPPCPESVPPTEALVHKLDIRLFSREPDLRLLNYLFHKIHSNSRSKTSLVCERVTRVPDMLEEDSTGWFHHGNSGESKVGPSHGQGRRLRIFRPTCSDMFVQNKEKCNKPDNFYLK